CVVIATSLRKTNPETGRRGAFLSHVPLRRPNLRVLRYPRGFWGAHRVGSQTPRVGAPTLVHAPRTRREDLSSALGLEQTRLHLGRFSDLLKQSLFRLADFARTAAFPGAARRARGLMLCEAFDTRRQRFIGFGV